jgi:hypothetical protein
MNSSRRNVLKMGVALSAIPLVGGFDAPSNSPGSGKQFFTTGVAALDRELGGGILPGSFVAVIGPRRSGKSAFLMRLAKGNGIVDAHAMNTGLTDMLSIMERADGRHIGSLMLDAAEPSTDKERQDMETNPAARQAFLTRWFTRTREVVRESGGLFAVSAWAEAEMAIDSSWMKIADYVICTNEFTCTLMRSQSPV